jgi:response regulator RpfG family c-di-GMP phosphodiesterase
MATAVLPNDDFYTNMDSEHLEIFRLIWLDANVHETRDTEQKLRSIINHLKKFQNLKQCQEYIEQRTQKDRIVLIVSGQMGREIVPSVHKHRQVIAIYVYCMDKKRNEEWSCKYKKVNL